MNIVDLIKSRKVEQESKISNEMLQHYSEERLKIQLATYKKDTLAILSTKLIPLVTEKIEDSPVVRTVTYSGYFINEEDLNKIKEHLEWTTEAQDNQPDSKNDSQVPAKRRGRPTKR